MRSNNTNNGQINTGSSKSDEQTIISNNNNTLISSHGINNFSTAMKPNGTNSINNNIKQQQCSVKIGKISDFRKIGRYLCNGSEFKVINISYGTNIDNISVRRIRQVLGKWSQSSVEACNSQVNLYISMPQIDLIQITRLSTLVQKQTKLKRDFQIYIEKQEYKSWNINNLTVHFDYNQDSIYYYNYHQHTLIGHKFLRAFWYQNYSSSHSTFNYQSLLTQLTKLSSLFQSIQVKKFDLTASMKKLGLRFEGFDKNKEKYYPSPSDLWDYFYKGMVTLTKSAQTLQELQIQYEICGYEIDDQFNQRILEQLATLPNLTRFALIYKLKDGLQRRGVIDEKELKSGMDNQRNVINCGINRGAGQMEHVSVRIMHGNTSLSSVEISRASTIENAQKGAKNQQNMQPKTNNCPSGNVWTRAYMEFKECAGRADWIGAMTSALKPVVLKQVEKLSISIERISGEQQQKSNEEDTGVYEMVLGILLENIRLRDCQLFIREDSFHFRLSKKLGQFKTKYVDSDNIASFGFTSSQTLPGLRLVFHFLHSLFTKSSHAAHQKNKWLLLHPQRINALLKQSQQQIASSTSTRRQSTTFPQLFPSKMEDSFINSLELDEKNPGEVKPITIQKSLKKPSSFTMGEDRIDENDDFNGFQVNNNNSNVHDKHHLHHRPDEVKSEIDVQYSEKESIIMQSSCNSEKKLPYVSSSHSSQSADNCWLCECTLEVECVDSFERYSDFLSESLCNLLSDQTKKLSIIIRDNNYSDKTNRQYALIQDAYQPVFMKILSAFTSWPAQTLVLSIYSKKINQYAIQLQNSYFQICNVRPHELVNIEMNIAQNGTSNGCNSSSSNTNQGSSSSPKRAQQAQRILNSPRKKNIKNIMDNQGSNSSSKMQGTNSMNHQSSAARNLANQQNQSGKKYKIPKSANNLANKQHQQDDKDSSPKHGNSNGTSSRIKPALKPLSESNSNNHNSSTMYDLIRRMNRYLISGKNWEFMQELQKMINDLKGRVLELHCQYHSVENEQSKDSIFSSLMHLNTESVRCVYANVYQQKQPQNINRNFFAWLDLLLSRRFPDQKIKKAGNVTGGDSKSNKQPNQMNAMSQFYKNSIENNNNNKDNVNKKGSNIVGRGSDMTFQQLSSEVVIHFHVQDVQLTFSVGREMRILKWLPSSSLHCDNELLRVIESKFGESIDLISSVYCGNDQSDAANMYSEEFEICAKTSVARIRVRGQPSQSHQITANNSSRMNIGQQQQQQQQNTQQYAASESNSRSSSNVKSGLCLQFGRVYSQIKRMMLAVNPKESQFQIKLALTVAKLPDLKDLQITFMTNGNAQWEEYSMLENLGDVRAEMIQIFVEDDEKDFKFLDQAKHIMHNLLTLNNLVTLQITVAPNDDVNQPNAKYKLRHFDFLTPFMYVPSKLIKLKLLTPHKHINEHFNMSRRHLLVLSIQALKSKKLFRQEILFEIFQYYVGNVPTNRRDSEVMENLQI